MLIPHLEVMQWELASAKDLVQIYHNISIANSLIDLATNFEIKIHILESIWTTWGHALSMIIQTHKPFIDKYGLIPPTQTPKEYISVKIKEDT